MASDIYLRLDIHIKLKQDISNEFCTESGEYENFVHQMSLSGVGKGLLKQKRSLLDKFKVLESNGLLGINNYDFLKKISTLSNNIWILEYIKKAEDDLLKLDRQALQTDTDTSAVQGMGDPVHIHLKLKQKLSNETDTESTEYENFCKQIEAKIGRGLAKRKKTPLDKLDALENGGLMAPGKYDTLRDIFEHSGNSGFLSFIDEADAEIEACRAPVRGATAVPARTSRAPAGGVIAVPTDTTEQDIPMLPYLEHLLDFNDSDSDSDVGWSSDDVFDDLEGFGGFSGVSCLANQQEYDTADNWSTAGCFSDSIPEEGYGGFSGVSSPASEEDCDTADNWSTAVCLSDSIQEEEQEDIPMLPNLEEFNDSAGTTGFGSPACGASTPSSGGLFGQTSTGTASSALLGGGGTAFGTQQQTGFNFGGTPAASGGLFGAKTTASTLFGTPTATNSSSFGFGGSTAGTTGFGSPACGASTPSSGGLFGQTSTGTASSALLGGGGTAFGTQQQTGFNFGGTPAASGGLFGAKTTASTLFGTPTATNSSSFGFGGSTGVEKVLRRQPLNMYKVEVEVKPFNPVHVPRKTVVVRGEGLHKDLLELYFESRKSNGGPIESLDLSIDGELAHLTFEDETGKKQPRPEASSGVIQPHRKVTQTKPRSGQSKQMVATDCFISSKRVTEIIEGTMDKGQSQSGWNSDDFITSQSLFEELFATTKNNNMFEGRILDIDVSVCANAIRNRKPFDCGGYGDVYLFNPTNNTEMSIVIKRIQCKDDDADEKLKSATCEMLAARLMHFGIVPLWAYAEDTYTKTWYFVLPFLENASLAENLHKDKTSICSSKTGTLILHKPERLRILYQVACALAFLHKSIPNFRSSYVHRDLTTRNIVLDSAFNARLLDFGLAREYTPGKDGVTMKTSDLIGVPGYFRTNMGKKLTVSKDVFNYGIVILEVLSSYPPIYGRQKKELRKKLTEGNFLDDFEEQIKPVWGDYKAKNNTAVSRLIDIATKCHQETITSAEIKKRLEQQVRELKEWQDTQAEHPDKNCVICLINAVDPDAQNILNHNANCKLHVCAACMRNSYLNPIDCHTCGKEVQPAIGHQWTAVLVAGNDVNDSQTAEIFRSDSDKIFKAITSRHPMTMGISKESVYRVYPDEPGTSQLLLPKLEETFNLVETKKIHSLFFYFTGHHGQKNGFKLGNNEEYLTMEKLLTCMKKAVEKTGCKRVLVLLDCCEAPAKELTLSCSYYQINSCNTNQTTKASVCEGSLLTAFFVQSLKGQSSADSCLLHQKLARPCEICRKFRSENGFIKIDQLHENVEKHIHVYDNLIGNEKHQIMHYFSGTGWRDAVFAYFIDNLGNFEFSLQHKELSSISRIVKQLPDKKEDLDIKLFVAYREEFKLLKLSPRDFSDMIAITYLTGPRHRHELTTIEKIEAAWNGKRQLCVSLREIKHLHRGKVGVFMDSDGTTSGAVLKCLDNDNVTSQRSQEGSTVVVTVSLEEDGARKLLRSVNASADTEQLIEQLREIRDNDKLEKKRKLVFTFPLKDEDDKPITNFYSMHVED